MDEHPAIVKRQIRRVAGDVVELIDDALAVEEPMEIRVRGKGIAVTMRTPGHDYELAAGFLITEGVIKNFSDVLAINHCTQGEAAETENIVNVFLSPKVEVDMEKLTRHVFASSSCGLCGKASIDAVHQQSSPIDDSSAVSTDLIRSLPDKLGQVQDVFSSTGGLHAAAVFDANGELVVSREDVGRHNAVDKVIGHGFLNEQLPFSNHVLMVSGRASFEILQKALVARIPTIAAVSAPSSLAVEFAERNNQTLVGFLRQDRMNVYSGSLESSRG